MGFILEILQHRPLEKVIISITHNIHSLSLSLFGSNYTAPRNLKRISSKKRSCTRHLPAKTSSSLYLIKRFASSSVILSSKRSLSLSQKKRREGGIPSTFRARLRYSHPIFIPAAFLMEHGNCKTAHRSWAKREKRNVLFTARS